MKNKIVINLKYISFIKPNFFKRSILSYTINCKQLMYFFFFMSFFFSTSSFFKNPRTSIFSYKKKKKMPSFLRAPYRHKKAQINLKSSFFIVNIIYSFIHRQHLNFLSLIQFYSFVLSYFRFIDSPLLSLYKQQYSIPFYLL